MEKIIKIGEVYMISNEDKYIIKSNKITLMPMSEEHISGLIKLWESQTVIKYTNMDVITNEEEVMERLDYLINACNFKNIIGVYTIFYKNKIVGCIGAPIVDKEQKVYGLFYQIAEEYWEKGYASEATDHIIKYIFTKGNAKKVVAHVVAENIASIRILEKKGLQRSSTEKDAFNKNNITSDVYEYEITKEYWKELREKEMDFLSYIWNF